MEDTRKAFLPKHTAQWRKVLFYIAPVLGLYIAFFTRLEVDNPKVSATLGVAVWMALWWVSEVVPLAITSLAGGFISSVGDYEWQGGIIDLF